MTTVKLFGNLRTHNETASLDIAGTNVWAVVATLCEGNSALREALLKDGQIRPHFIITVNGKDIQLLQGLDTPLGDDDQLAIFPPIAGG